MWLGLLAARTSSPNLLRTSEKSRGPGDFLHVASPHRGVPLPPSSHTCGCPSLVSSCPSVPHIHAHSLYLLPIASKDSVLSLCFSVTQPGLWVSKCSSGKPFWSAAQPVALLCHGAIKLLPVFLQEALCSLRTACLLYHWPLTR